MANGGGKLTVFRLLPMNCKNIVVISGIQDASSILHFNSTIDGDAANSTKKTFVSARTTSLPFPAKI